MSIIYGILGTFALLMQAMWAMLPGAFGASNFNEKYGFPFGFLGYLAWFTLVIAHPVSIYYLWSGISNDAETIYAWILFPVPFHIIFFVVFGRNVSTR